MKGLSKKIITGPQDQKMAALMAKVFLWGLSSVWVFIYLAVALVIYDKGFHAYMVKYFTPIGEEISSWANVAVHVFDAWYILTMVIFGVVVALKAFKFVGKWEWQNKKDSNAPSK